MCVPVIEAPVVLLDDVADIIDEAMARPFCGSPFFYLLNLNISRRFIGAMIYIDKI